MRCSLQELVCQINRKQGLNCGIFQKRNPNCKFWSVQELHVLSLNGYKTHGLNRGIFQVRVHVLTSGRVQELHVVTRTRTTKNPTKNFTFSLRNLWLRFLNSERGRKIKERKKPEKREMSRQAKNLVSFFSSKISSFSYSQSRSFTAAPQPPPAVFVSKNCQGITGKNVTSHPEQAIEYGTKMVYKVSSCFFVFFS